MAKARHSILSDGIGGMQGAILDRTTLSSFPEKPGMHVKSRDPAPFIIFYEHHHFQGAMCSSFFDLKYLGDWWSDKVASLVVAAGVWQLFPEREHKGTPWVIGPGIYDNVHVEILSIKAVRDAEK
jgi:hypothetical protein